MKQISQLETEMRKLAQDYAFDYFGLDNSDERIPMYMHRREQIQSALMKMNPEERRIIAFSFLFQDNQSWWKQYYSQSKYELKKNLALVSFFRCLKT